MNLKAGDKEAFNNKKLILRQNHKIWLGNLNCKYLFTFLHLPLAFDTISCMKSKIEEIKKKAVPILREAGVTRSSLFGSVVRGEVRKDSDIDILVELPKGKSLLDLVRLEKKLKGVLGKEVDMLTYNSIHPLVKDYIQIDQVQII